MLPRKRCCEDAYAVPKFELDSADVEDFKGELEAYHEEFAECFKRKESKENFLRYLQGQFSSLERKSIEPMALAVEGGKVRAMQQFVSDAAWQDDTFRLHHHRHVAEELGEEDGCLLFDESGFVKKGENSAGVSRQYCGNIGKVENAQVGVYMAYASSTGYALTDAALYMPKSWFDPEFAERRKQNSVPEDLTFRTKPEIAAELLTRAAQEQILPFKYILGDALYGDNPDFVKACLACIGKTFLLAVSSNRTAYPVHPVIKYGVGRTTKSGRKNSKIIASNGTGASLKSIAESLHETFWHRRTVSEGTKGPIEYEFTRRTVRMALTGDGELTLVTLLIKRSIGPKREYRFYICNASSSHRLKLLVWLSGMRWPIEQLFEEGKCELGMDHYEVRKWTGWHHHMMICMAGLWFLFHLMLRLGKKSGCPYYVPDAPFDGVRSSSPTADD